MPTYSYRCPGCDQVFDEHVKIAEMDLPQPCTCGQQAVRDLGATLGAMTGHCNVSSDMDFNTKLAKMHAKDPDWIPPSAGGTTVSQDPRTGKLVVGTSTKKGRGSPGGKASYFHQQITDTKKWE